MIFWFCCFVCATNFFYKQFFFLSSREYSGKWVVCKTTKIVRLQFFLAIKIWTRNFLIVCMSFRWCFHFIYKLKRENEYMDILLQLIICNYANYLWGLTQLIILILLGEISLHVTSYHFLLLIKWNKSILPKKKKNFVGYFVKKNSCGEKGSNINSNIKGVYWIRILKDNFCLKKSQRF